MMELLLYAWQRELRVGHPDLEETEESRRIWEWEGPRKRRRERSGRPEAGEPGKVAARRVEWEGVDQVVLDRMCLLYT
jgi:hypothetical protein